MQRVLAAAILTAVLSLSSCASTTRYSADVSGGDLRILADDGIYGPRVQLPFSVPSPGVYDLVLWYAFTDAGAGYDALGRVSGTVAVTYRGQLVQSDMLPRHGKRSELFTDPNGLILTRFRAESAGRYVLKLHISSVPPHLEIGGAGLRVLKLAENQ